MTAKIRKKRKNWIIWLVVIVLLASMLLIGRQFLLRRSNPLADVRSTQATVGSIAKTITGTGNLSAEDTTVDFDVLNGLMIDQILFEAGDFVAKGDVIATFEQESLQTAIWNTQAEVARLDSQISLALGKTESQYVTTAVAGRIKKILISEGDEIQAVMAEQGALMILSLDGQMKVAFKAATIADLAKQDQVDVKLSDGTTVAGTIVRLADDFCEVTLSDQSAVLGDQVTISLDDRELGAGQLEINQPMTITATDGVVAEIRYSLNAKVSAGARLIRLESAPVSQNYLKLLAQREDQVERLTTLMRYVRDGGVVASQTGEILTMALADGQTTLEAVNNKADLTIRTKRDIILNMKIDELDIAVLAIGQPAEITIDALPDLNLIGTVIDIDDQGIIGQSSSAYTVKIDVPDESVLRLGLTSRAVIIAEKHDNIVKLPLAALQESGGEQYVYVGSPVSALDLGEKRLVTIGISDGEYVEITSGLSGTETVNYFYATGDSNLYPFPGGGIRQNTTTND
jgi:HlyD family secretion protein